MLHRDRSKTEDKDDDASSVGTSNPGSAAGSPTSHHAFNQFRLQRPRPQPAEQPTLETTSASLSHTSHPAGLVASQSAGATIEQSVRTFRLFEILRSSDNAAITKAVLETSKRLDAGSGPQATSSSSSQSGPLEGTTLLHLAVQCAEPSVVEQILSIANTNAEIDLDINGQDRMGSSPLHLASKLGRATIVRILLMQPNVDPSLLNYQGRSPLDLARNPEIFQQLQLAQSMYIETKVKAIQSFVSHGDYSELEKLLEDSRVEAALDVNWVELSTDPSTTETGGTLLHEAAKKKDLRLIQLLLLHGADPFRRDRRGKLPQDVTRDDKTRAILKRSPAAAAAQRGIQEKAILGNPQADRSLGAGKESREIKGYLKKWTNYTTGYKLRWFVLEDGVLSYYKNQGRPLL